MSQIKARIIKNLSASLVPLLIPRFLDSITHLYKRSRPSARPSVRLSPVIFKRGIWPCLRVITDQMTMNKSQLIYPAVKNCFTLKSLKIIVGPSVRGPLALSFVLLYDLSLTNEFMMKSF